MRLIIFAKRNFKEIIRDKLNLAFGLGFPVIVLLLLSLIQSNLPIELFQISKLAPGVAVFGLSFISLFSGLLISKDRDSSFMLRLFTSPLTAKDFILGYTVPLLPISIIQVIITFIIALLLGLQFNLNFIISILFYIPSSILFISIGLLCGTVFNEKQVGGICGALLTNLSAWLSGIWFDLEFLGKGVTSVAKALPFYHAVNMGRLAVAGNYSDLWINLAVVLLYSVIIMILAIWLFTKKMKSPNN